MVQGAGGTYNLYYRAVKKVKNKAVFWGINCFNNSSISQRDESHVCYLPKVNYNRERSEMIGLIFERKFSPHHR